MSDFMLKAIEEAKKGIENGEGGPFGTVIVKNGKIIALGHNQVIKNQDPTCHGEMQAIRTACKELHSFDLSGCDLYTTAEPCPMCLGAIQWANIHQIYYGCDVIDTEKIGFRDQKFYQEENNVKNNMIRDNVKECQDLFAIYAQLENKKNY